MLVDTSPALAARSRISYLMCSHQLQHTEMKHPGAFVKSKVTGLWTAVGCGGGSVPSRGRHL
jgi:hypothetical protein